MTTNSSPQSSGLDPKIASFLAYLCPPFTGLLILLLERENAEVRFHAWHGIAFGVFLIAVGFIITILSNLFWMMSFWLYGIFSMFLLLLWITLFVVWVVLLVRAYQGAVLVLPYLTEWARKQSQS